MPVEIDNLKVIINQYGMPIVAAGGMGYFIYFIWKFVTENINSELSTAKKTIIDLIDRIRMLDNDLIRLEQKINTSIELQRGSTTPSASPGKDIPSDETPNPTPTPTPIQQPPASN